MLVLMNRGATEEQIGIIDPLKPEKIQVPLNRVQELATLVQGSTHCSEKSTSLQ